MTDLSKSYELVLVERGGAAARARLTGQLCNAREHAGDETLVILGCGRGRRLRLS